MTPASSTLYDLLGVAPDASDREIKRAFRQAARSAHPDRGGDPERFRSLRDAYEVLSDGARRSSYDADLSQGVRDQDDFDDAWGVEDRVPSPAPFASDVGSPTASVSTRGEQDWSLWRGLTLALLTLAILTVGYWALMASQPSGSSATLVAMVMTCAVPLRVTSRWGVGSLIVEVGTVVTSAAVLTGHLPWPYHPAAPLVLSLLMAASGEVMRPPVRRAMVRRKRERAERVLEGLARQWDAMVAASRTHGHLYWLVNCESWGNRTESLVFDPSAGEHSELMLWGAWPPHVWVVVDRAGVVVASCSDRAREVWVEKRRG